MVRYGLIQAAKLLAVMISTPIVARSRVMVATSQGVDKAHKIAVAPIVAVRLDWHAITMSMTSNAMRLVGRKAGRDDGTMAMRAISQRPKSGRAFRPKRIAACALGVRMVAGLTWFSSTVRYPCSSPPLPTATFQVRFTCPQ